jgi:hypothetical protein
MWHAGDSNFRVDVLCVNPAGRGRWSRLERHDKEGHIVRATRQDSHVYENCAALDILPSRVVQHGETIATWFGEIDDRLEIEICYGKPRSTIKFGKWPSSVDN